MSDQQQQQEEYAPTPSVAAAEETESITSLEDYVQKCAGRLEATVANSCANEDDGHPLCKLQTCSEKTATGEIG